MGRRQYPLAALSLHHWKYKVAANILGRLPLDTVRPQWEESPGIL